MTTLAGIGSGRRRASIVKSVLIALLAAAAAIALGTGLARAQAPARTSGIVHLYEAGTTTGNTDSDVLTGAISDYGVDHEGRGNFNKIVLTKGSFEVNTAKLTAKIHPVSEDLADCSIVVAGSGPVTTLHGTGAYKGIHGTIKVNFTDAIVFKVKKGGKCSPSPTAPQKASVTEITGSGRVSF
jgi:hypothetical protein